MVLVIILSVIVGALGICYYLFNVLNYFKKHGIPHLKSMPILGNMGPLVFRQKHITFLIQDAYCLNPDAKYVGFYDMTKPVILLRDPELIKTITLKNFESFMDHRVFTTDDLDPLVGRTLICLTGERWRKVRNIMSPSFTSSKMKGMFKLMSCCAVNFAEFLKEMPLEESELESKDTFSRYTNDVIATCAFGVSVDSMRNRKNLFYLYGKEATVLDNVGIMKFVISGSLPLLAKLIGLRIVSKKVATFFRNLVETTIKTRDEKGIVRLDMLQLMMETRNKKEGTELSLDDMVGQAFGFFFAGYDTTSTLMCFTAHEIAVNQDIRERLQNDIDQVLEETNGEPTYEAINAMEYLDAVICEALRMYPISAVFDRLCVKDFELPPMLPGMKPYIIKKNEGVWVPISALHQDPKYFSEPKKFDPERFLGEQKKQILNCGAYCPFGIGPRMCIGNRFALLGTKMLLFHLLARCDLKPSKKTSHPIKLAIDGLNMKPEGGFWLNVHPRKNLHHTIAGKAVVNDKRTL